MNAPDYVHASYLWKRGQLNSDWKKRLCSISISQACIKYFNYDGPIGPGFVLPSGPRGGIDLSQAISANPTDLDENEPDYSFDIVLPDRLWRFQAETVEDRKIWLDIVNCIIEFHWKRPFQALKVGPILKLSGAFFKDWALRYLVLCPRHLVYFERQEIAERFLKVCSRSAESFYLALKSDQLDGLVPLAGATVSASQEPGGFEVTSGARVLSFRTESEDLMAAWVDAIRDEISQLARVEAEFMAGSKKKPKKKKKKSASEKSRPKSRNEEKYEKEPAEEDDDEEEDPSASTTTPSSSTSSTYSFSSASYPVSPRGAPSSTSSSTTPTNSSASNLSPTSTPSASTSTAASASTSSSSASTEDSMANPRPKKNRHHRSAGSQSEFVNSPNLRPAPSPSDQLEEEANRRAEERINQMKQEQIRQAQEQQERTDLEEIIHAEVIAWAKKKRDIRLMISSLHEIFAVAEGDFVLAPNASKAQVRKCYLKLMPVIHPDRLVGELVEKQICASALFSVLRTAYDEFMARDDSLLDVQPDKHRATSF
eukprot:TRINITY_DN1436_c0_g2_i6.p1 TRINITY_DN1436_c0_g2~~TRINITY_DN1436_c0_g2_i6.p1  ORF type:complete len:564 (-),score=147.93 TRINITY_DN1436_c0_g2_i6:157-1776(-)